MQPIARESTITLNGKEYRLAKATTNRLDEFVEWCKTKLPNPIKLAGELIGSFPAEHRELLVRVAMEEGSSPLSINSPRVQALASTPDGSVRLFHILIKPNHPEVTLDELAEWMKNADATELQKAFAKVSGTKEVVVNNENPQVASQDAALTGDKS